MSLVSIQQILLTTLLLSSQCVNGLQSPQEPILGDAEDDVSCHNACTALVNELEEITHYGPVSELKGFSESYYSDFQREIVPACVVTPTSAAQVASAISLLRSYPCPIAVKSGGHAVSAGLSNVVGGITFDLRLLNQIEYLGAKDWDGSPAGESADGWEGEITRLGPGSRWGEVYEKLQPYGVNVIGGRDSKVGVGGFTLGGGISFLSHTHGWAADAVRNYQLVLPNGTLTNVNHASNPKLFSALRGGGSNFGIVTRFDVETYRQGLVWGGYRFWSASPFDIAHRKAKLGIPVGSSLTFAKLTQLHTLGHAILGGLLRLAAFVGYSINIIDFVKAFEEVVLNPEPDHASHLFMSVGYIKFIDQITLTGNLAHINAVPEPEIFKPYSKIKHVYSLTGLTNVSNIADEISKFNVAGYRQVWDSQTVLASPSTSDSTMTLSTLLSEAIDIFLEETEKIKHLVDLITAITFQPINVNAIKHFQKNGGNALGIGASEGPLVIINSSISYKSKPRTVARDDVLARAAMHNFHTRCRDLARASSMHHGFQYLNYADGKSDVFDGAGGERREWLRGVKRDVLGKGERWDVAGIKV